VSGDEPDGRRLPAEEAAAELRLRTERADPIYRDLDAWPLARILGAVVASGERAAATVAAASEALEAAAAGIESRLRAGGRLVYVGAGTSGRIAVQDAAELPPTFGFERAVVLLAGGGAAGSRALENAEDDVDAAVADVQRIAIGASDAVVGVAASGRTPYTLAVVRGARKRGAFTVGVANNAGTPLLSAPEVGILLDTGPEVLAGSTRLAAGTAQKIALNALSTAVLVRAGGAYRNLMVGMRPTNEKLRHRAVAMVAETARVPATRARNALERSGWSVREAIVMARTDLGLAEVTALLWKHDWRVRDALAAAGAEPDPD